MNRPLAPPSGRTHPTRTAILFDPTVQRMHGFTLHGGIEFDAPHISQVTDDLWLGGCTEGLVLPHFIDHVVSLCPWETYEIDHVVKSVMTVRMYDNAESPVDREELLAIADWVNVCRRTGTVLVHCQAGLNRSGLVAGLAMVLRGLHPAEAIQTLRDARGKAVLCNPLFERWLLEFSL